VLNRPLAGLEARPAYVLLAPDRIETAPGSNEKGILDNCWRGVDFVTKVVLGKNSWRLARDINDGDPTLA
jgi:hypothetical protein